MVSGAPLPVRQNHGDSAEGVDVGGLVRLGPEAHLGGDETRRAVHGTGLTPGHARGPEVEQHRAPVGGHRDVGGRDVGVQASRRVQVGDGLAHRGEHGDDLTRPQVTTAAHHAASCAPRTRSKTSASRPSASGHHRPQGHEMVVLHGEQDLLLGHRLLPVELVAAAVRHLDRHAPPGRVGARPHDGRRTGPDHGLDTVPRDLGPCRRLRARGGSLSVILLMQAARRRPASRSSTGTRTAERGPVAAEDDARDRQRRHTAYAGRCRDANG